MRKDKDKTAFLNQKNRAKARGISFDLTFEEWLSWWESQLGPAWREMRGRTKGKFCMSRIGDLGAYNLQNIFCKTHSENSSDKQKNRTSAYGIKNASAKLTEGQVLAIFASKESTKKIATSFGVSIGTVRRIKRKDGWTHLCGVS